ncbi:MAG: hypothetical protein KKD63_16605 [Proteobacteria bacterium]|nr:hypothetical protein [Pseudomonadota bacterium]
MKNLLRTKKQKPLSIPLVWNSRGYRRGIKWGTAGMVLLIILVAFFFVAWFWYAEQVNKTNKLFGSLVYAKTQEYVAPHELTEREQIDNYIQEVFGSNSDYANRILDCENHARNPKAVNTTGNTPTGSRDIGIFQINEYWQKTQGKFLLNWKINVEVAHQLYVENGNSFKLWSCAKKVGVN